MDKVDGLLKRRQVNVEKRKSLKKNVRFALTKITNVYRQKQRKNPNNKIE